MLVCFETKCKLSMVIGVNYSSAGDSFMEKYDVWVNASGWRVDKVR